MTVNRQPAATWEGGMPDEPPPKRNRSAVARLVEQHVALSLKENYQQRGSPELTTTPSRALSSEDLRDLTEAFVTSEPGTFMSSLERLGFDDLDFARFYRLVMTPVSRQLGEWWCEDRLGFLGVTMAIERLRLTVDTLYPDEAIETALMGRQILINCLDDDAHTFGAFLLRKAFTMNGWHVVQGSTHDIKGSPVARLSRDHYHAFGISVGDTTHADACRALIARARAASVNRDIVIAIGGSGVANAPDRFEDIGADVVSADALDAVAGVIACCRERIEGAQLAAQ